MNPLPKNIPSSYYLLRIIPSWLPGKTRLCNSILGTSKINGPIKLNVINITLETPSIKESISKHIIFDGIYEKETYDLLKKILKKDSVFFDIGANVGLFSILASKNLNPSGKTFSFEASPTIFHFLKNNANANNCSNLSIFNNAVYDKSDYEISFFEAPPDKYGMGSLYDRAGSNKVQIKTISIDDFMESNSIKNVDLIKIDIEGYEKFAFEGAKKLFSRPDAPKIIFEFNDWGETPEKTGTPQGEAQRILRNFGYKTQKLENWIKKPCSNEEIVTKGGCNIIAWK